MSEFAEADARFHTTRWTVVVKARDKTSPESEAALEALCRAYWFPLYAFARRSGRSPHDAQDLTQDFFLKVLRKELLDSAERERGKFRTFMLTLMKRFMVNAYEASRAEKRGGDCFFIPADSAEAESRYLAEPVRSSGADALYEKQWALALLEKVMLQLRTEYSANGQDRLYERLKPCLTASRGEIPYDEMASTLKMNEGAVRTAVSRLRKRFREIFRDCVADTVDGPHEVDVEMKHLIGVIGGL